MKSFPISLVGLQDRRAIVVGGGNVAARKVAGLLDADALVTVIAPRLCEGISELARRHRLAAHERKYQEGDLMGAFLAIAATSDKAVNLAVAGEAKRGGCLVNVVDDAAHSDFIMPAVIQRGELTISISTGGASPALARRLRERLESEIGAEYGDLAALLSEMRPGLLAKYNSPERRLSATTSLIDSELLDILRSRGIAAAREYATARLEQNTE